jgi:hypothetical protein
MAKTIIQIIMTLIPITAYIITWLWTRRLIRLKITNKTEKKKYSRFINEQMGGFFAPIFLFGTLTPIMIFIDTDTLLGINLLNFILRIVLLCVQTLYSILVFRRLKIILIRLKRSTVDIILLDIEKYG